MTQLNTTFKDINPQAKAAKSLLGNKFDIDKGGPQGFFANYEILAREARIVAGNADSDIIHVSNLNRLLPFNLRDMCNSADPTPMT